MGGKAGKVVIFVAIIVVAVYLKMSRMSDFGEDIRTEMKPVVLAIAGSEDETEFLDRQFEISHQVAFNAAYEIGGRRRRAKFDEQAYVEKLFDHMIDGARRLEKKDIAEQLSMLRTVMRVGMAQPE